MPSNGKKGEIFYPKDTKKVDLEKEKPPFIMNPHKRMNDKSSFMPSTL